MLQKKKILLVEDEEITAFLSKKILHNNNYEVVHADTGEKAVKIAEENTDIDLVLMDIDLGPGIDGTEAAQIILRKRDLPLVFMSSHTEKAVVEKTEGISSYGYIVKHSGETVLLASLKMAFKLHDQKALVAQKEKALIEREQLFSAFMDNIPLMAIIKDKDIKPVYYNKMLIDRFPHDAQLGKATEELFTGEQLQQIKNSDKIVFEKGLHNYEETIVDEFGKKTYLEIYKFLIERHDVANQLGVIIHDITEKKEAQLAHAQTTEQLQASLSNTPNVAIQWYNEQGKVIYWNKASEKLYGFSETEAIGKNLDALIYTKEEHDTFLEIIQNVKKTGIPYGPFETEIRHKDGSQGWVLATTFSIPLDENSNGYVCMDVDITNLKEIQKDLLIKESAITNSLHAIAITDLNGQLIYVNPKFLNLFGYSSKEQLFGNHFKHFLSDPDELKGIKTRLLQEGIWTGNIRAKRNDSSTFSASISANSIINENGETSYFLTYVRDNTEKERIKNKHAEDHLMLQMVLDAIPQAYFKKDVQGVFLDCNLAFVRQVEAASKEDIIGKTDFELIKNNSESTYFQNIDKEVIESGMPKLHFEEKLTQSDGSVTWLETSKIPFFDQHGKVAGIIGIFDNITSRKIQEEKIKQQEQLYRSMFDVNTAIKLLIDPENGQIIDANDAALHFYGYSKEEFLKQKISHINTLSQDEIKEEMALATAEKRLNFKFRHKLSNNEIRDVDVYSGPIDVNGKKYLHSIVFDITDRIHAEKKVQELLQEKDLILKEVHHRVKNNMGTIFNLLTIQSELLDDGKAKEVLLDAASRTQSMMILYDNLYRSDNFRTLDIQQFLPNLITDITQVFKPIQQLKTSFQIDSCIMHSKMLSSIGIIVNELITNSIKYAFAEVKNPEITISLKQIDEKQLHLVYSDNGNGIPDSINFTSSSGFGMQLIGMLIKQLQGKGEIIHDAKSEIQITFPI